MFNADAQNLHCMHWSISLFLSLIPKLQHGLDVNVQFNNGPQAFEFTEELEVFDAIAVTLRHGWLVDPQDSEVLNVIKKFPNYNRFVSPFVILAISFLDGVHFQVSLPLAVQMC